MMIAGMHAGISPGVMRRINGNARLASLFGFLRKRHADRHAGVKTARHVRAVSEFKPPGPVTHHIPILTEPQVPMTARTRGTTEPRFPETNSSAFKRGCRVIGSFR